MNRIKSIILAGCLLLTAGCGRQIRTVHPGAINTYDSVAYDTLIASQAALEESKAQAANKPAYKGGLNHAIESYNTALTFYRVYHNGVHSNLQLADLNAALEVLAKDIAALQRSLGRK